MNKIFSRLYQKAQEIMGEDKQSNQTYSDITLIPQKNQKENNIIIEIKEEPSINATEKNLNSVQVFISKKRKKSRKNAVETASSETNENSEITSNKKSSHYKYRLDYFKKAFKVNCINYLTKKLNDFFLGCHFPKKFKQKKFHKSNDISFTSNTKKGDNIIFLKMKIKELYCFLKNDSIKGSKKQKKNENLIEMILNYIPPNENREIENLKNALNITFKDYIHFYYNTQEFQSFCKKEKKLFIEKKFKKKRFFSTSRFWLFEII